MNLVTENTLIGPPTAVRSVSSAAILSVLLLKWQTQYYLYKTEGF